MKILVKGLIMVLCFVISAGFLTGCNSNSLKADKNLGREPKEMAVVLVTDLSKTGFQNAMDDFDYTNEMEKVLNPEVYQGIWTQIQTQNGSFIKINGTKTIENGEFLSVRVQCVFEKSNLDLQVTFDKNNIISGFHILEYSGGIAKMAVPDNIKEASITFGEDAFLLSGTFTTPAQGENFPCVILVHGSGPQDRDEAKGPNAPFRDIAWGLAQQGIASIRYDKRTKTYGKYMGADTTPKEETIDDVVHAVNYAGELVQINGNGIFILGYDFGGYLIPKIAAVTPGAAGYMILGGSTSPLEDIILRQYDYLASLDNTITRQEAETMTQAKTAWDKVKQLNNESTESSSQLLGISRDYWLYLKNYEPTEEMEAVEKPAFILQGEEDYQVNMTEYSQWQNALLHKNNVIFKSYSGLNHLFMKGNGLKSPEEYEIPGVVSQDVINDLAKFAQENTIDVSVSSE
ncbi:alpha/beta hydrolase [Acetobacterium bakii]|uniref:alpha/beta hydrolase n=1 Tax=Acetobacterium bakii TaxID=52689 RepID=UPI00067F9444|nr:DUF3887 domain-containing protein [Acetobacterium bakii]